ETLDSYPQVECWVLEEIAILLKYNKLSNCDWNWLKMVADSFSEEENPKIFKEAEELVNKFEGPIMGEDDYIEGVFLIEGETKEIFLERRIELEELTGFSDDFTNHFEEDEEGGIWKWITTCHFDTLAELKRAALSMEQIYWLFMEDSSLLFKGKEIYCDGKWIDKNIKEAGLI
ncbi:MAG: hypothetical protein GY757_02320, partial [bacterium]|nr:hypothetical protein [bacterium]